MGRGRRTAKRKRRRGLPWLAPALLLAVVAAGFAGALPEELTYDAQTVVGANSLIEPATPWWKLLVSNYWGDQDYDGLYRPLTLLLLRWQRGTLGFGDDAGGYVAVNILLHALVTLAVWLLARRWLTSRRAALGAAALFGAHPLASAVVPNIVGVADLLAALFVVSSLIALEPDAEGRRRPLLASALWLGGLLSKESAVILPVLVAVRHFSAGPAPADGEPARSQGASARIRAYLPLVATGGVWLAARQAILAGRGERFILAVDNPLVLETIWTRWMTALALLASYLRQALLPLRLSADYSFDHVPIVTSPASGELAAALAVLAAAAVAGVVAWRRCRPAAAGLIWFFAALAPFSNLLFPLGTIRADRLLYLPLVGLAFAAGELLDRLAGAAETRYPPRWAKALFPAVLALVLAAGLAKTRHEAATWRDNLAIWENAVVTTPDNVKAHFNLATYLEGNSPPASQRTEEHLETAVEISRRVPGDEYNYAHVRLGTTYLRRAGAPGLAEDRRRALLGKSVRLLEEAATRQAFPGRRQGWFERVRQSDTPQGRRAAALPAKLANPGVYLALAAGLERLGRSAEALERLEEIATLFPRGGRVRLQLGTAYARRGRWADAETELEAAIRLLPDLEQAWVQLAGARLQAGDYRRAIDTLSEARGRLAGSAAVDRALRQAYVGIFRQLLAAGRPEEALAIRDLATGRDSLPPELFARPE